ncbi:MAG: type II secretion system major pseudopilin GspG [Pseudomonadota bacterium]
MRIVLKQFCDSVASRTPVRKLPPARHAVSEGETGLTLIEMMIVLVIIAIVAGLVTMNVINRPDEAKVTATKSNLAAISGALKMYRLDNGDYPTTEQGLKALVERPATPPVPTNWATGGYLEQAPVDPFGNPYVYEYSGAGGYVLKSLGKDGKPGGEGVNADIDSKG